jgi:peroxiredoxin
MGGGGSKTYFTKRKIIAEGSSVPNVTFNIRVLAGNDPHKPYVFKKVTSEDLFKNKRVVVFGVPGG